MEVIRDSAYQLLLARLMAIEADMEALRERVAVEADMEALRERVAELEAELHEAWMGGTD